MSDDPVIQNSSKKALVFGASGLVGSHVVSLLLEHPAYHEVHAFYRSGSETQFEKLQKRVIDFEKLEDYQHLIQGNDLFICLGTTIGKAGSKKNFYHLEYEYITTIAKIAETNKVGQVLIISSMGADAKSMFFYSQVKGLIEDKIKTMDFWSIHFLRPSVLLGQREESRPMESFAAGAGLALRAMGPKLFSKITPIEAYKVALSMVKLAQETKSGVFYHSSDVLAKLGKK